MIRKVRGIPRVRWEEGEMASRLAGRWVWQAGWLATRLAGIPAGWPASRKIENLWLAGRKMTIDGLAGRHSVDGRLAENPS